MPTLALSIIDSFGIHNLFTFALHICSLHAALKIQKCIMSMEVIEMGGGSCLEIDERGLSDFKLRSKSRRRRQLECCRVFSPQPPFSPATEMRAKTHKTWIKPC
jgi:hypothetical protein